MHGSDPGGRLHAQTSSRRASCPSRLSFESLDFEATAEAPLPCRASADFLKSLLLAAHSRSRIVLPVPSGSRASPRQFARPSQVSDGLWPDGHVARSTLASRPPRMSGSHPDIVALGLERPQVFPEQNAEALGYPPGWTVRGPAPSPVGPHWQALRFAPLVVELFPAAVFLRAVPGPLVLSPVRLFAQIGSPHASRVVRASSALTPRAGFSPASHHHGLSSRRGVSLSPPFLGEYSIG